MNAVTRIAGPIARPAYTVTLTSTGAAGAYRIESATLNDLADRIESEIRTHTREHVGVYLDPDGTVWVRYRWQTSFPAGTWSAAR